MSPYLFSVTKGCSTVKVSTSNSILLILSFCKDWRVVIVAECSSCQLKFPESVNLVRWLIMLGTGRMASTPAPRSAFHLIYINWRNSDVFKFPGMQFSLASYPNTSPKSNCACLNFSASGTCRKKRPQLGYADWYIKFIYVSRTHRWGQGTVWALHSLLGAEER